jgi:hypothetical protein
MTEVNFSEAVEIYEQYFHNHTPASFHPNYVQMDALRDNNLKPIYFVYQEQDEYFYHAFHCSVIPNTMFIDIQSPYGYGGAILTTDDPVFLQHAWLAYEIWCKDHNVLVEFIRFHPLLPSNHYIGDVFLNRQTIYIETQNDDLFTCYETRVRTAIRKAQRLGLSVEWTSAADDYNIFEKIYRDTMKRLQADEYYYFSTDYFNAAQNWQDCRLALCKLDDEVLAASMFLESPYVMEYHLSCSTEQGRKFGASNLLVHEAANYAKFKGIPYVHLGGGTDNRSDNPLLFFKAGFSSHSAQSNLGRKIFFPNEYMEMKQAWEAEHQKPAEWILFYRS